MNVTRRKFLGAASVGIASAGLASAGMASIGPASTKPHIPALTGNHELDQIILAASERAVNPPLVVNTYPGGVTCYDFEKVGDQLFSRGA